MIARCEILDAEADGNLIVKNAVNTCRESAEEDDLGFVHNSFVGLI